MTDIDGELRDPERHGALSKCTLRHRGMKRRDALDAGAKVIIRHPKKKYVTFAGDRRERSALRAALRYEPLPYPRNPAWL